MLFDCLQRFDTKYCDNKITKLIQKMFDNILKFFGLKKDENLYTIPANTYVGSYKATTNVKCTDLLMCLKQFKIDIIDFHIRVRDVGIA
jgi:hypothetical protein